MAAQYLRGEKRKGMFSNEVAFVVVDSMGKPHVLLVSEDMVETRHGSPTIRVRIVDQAEDVALVRVPGEALDSNTVSVRTSQLVA